MNKIEIKYIQYISHYCKIGLVGIVLMSLFIGSAILRMPRPLTENWLNSDATYHVLLTFNAYDQTPVSQHKFLPIVSLGEKEDKCIPWGATIPDKEGNYYYTSFAPLGFAVPYLFMKMFALPLNEFGLYVFNSGIFFLCWILCVYLFIIIFKSKKNSLFVAVIVTLIYLFSMETMHSHGVVYWPAFFVSAYIYIAMHIVFETK